MSDEVSIRRFTWLLRQRAYSYLAEDQLDRALRIRGGKRPDFLVDTGRVFRFLAEVKAFQTPTALDESPALTGAMFVGDIQKRINSGPLVRAAKQLAPYAAEDLARVVILDNHRQVGVGLGKTELIQIFGSLQYEFTIDTSTGAAVSEGWAHRLADSAIGDQKRPFISAVVVNIPTQRFDTFDGVVDDFMVPRLMRVHVIHNPDATHPLPLWVFSEPYDKQIIRQGQRWIELSCPPESVRHSDIAARAHTIFERNGRMQGRDRDDWMQAERELRDEIA